MLFYNSALMAVFIFLDNRYQQQFFLVVDVSLDVFFLNLHEVRFRGVRSYVREARTSKSHNATTSLEEHL